MSVNVPEKWKKISPKNYNSLGLIDNDLVSCVASYFVEGEKPNIINFYDYSKHNEEFLVELDKYYDEIEEINELIDGDPDDEDYESTATIRSLYHGFLNDTKNTTYLNISKVLVNDGYSCVLQLFLKGNNGIYCMEMNLYDVNEKTIVKDIKKNQIVLEAIQVLKSFANK